MGAKSIYHLGTKLAIWRADGRVLVLWRNKDQNSHWDLPGGCPHPGEDPVDALKRDVREEIGPITFDEPCPVQLVMTPFKPFGDETGLILWYHSARLRGNGAIVLGNEHSSAEWIDWSEAERRLSEGGLKIPDLRIG